MLKLRSLGINGYSVLEGRQRIGRIRLALTLRGCACFSSRNVVLRFYAAVKEKRSTQTPWPPRDWARPRDGYPAFEGNAGRSRRLGRSP